MKHITDVLVKPLITEKSNQKSEKLGRFTFVVAFKSSKEQIKAAVETMYGVHVNDVNQRSLYWLRRKLQQVEIVQVK